MYKRTGESHSCSPSAYLIRDLDEEGIKQSRGFKKTFSRTVDVDFMGVWYVTSEETHMVANKRQGTPFPLWYLLVTRRLLYDRKPFFYRAPLFRAICHLPAPITSSRHSDTPFPWMNVVASSMLTFGLSRWLQMM